MVELSETAMNELDKKIQDMSENLFARLTQYVDNAIAKADGGQNDTNAPAQAPESNSKAKRAEKAQEDCAFDANDVYETLVDPRGRSKKELEQYAEEAVTFYGTGKYTNIHDAFVNDFIYWDESHFKLVKKSSLSTIDQYLRNQGVSIRPDGRFALWRMFGEYIDNLWDTNFAMDDNGGEKCTMKEALNEEPHVDPGPSSGEQMVPHEAPRYRTDARSRGRPSDVSKLFGRELKYGGTPTEPLRRRYKTFMNAVQLCGIDPENTSVLFPLLETSFLTNQALLHYQDVIRDSAQSVDEVIDLLEAHFLGHRSRRVNDEIWENLSYKFVTQKRGAENKTTTHEAILADLLEQIADMADIRTGPGSETIIMAKTIAAVRGIDVYSTVCQNPPLTCIDLFSILRSCALEKDRENVKNGGENATKPDGLAYKAAIKRVARQEAKRYYIDRVSRNKNSRKSVPGYGRSKSPIRFRVPKHICIICGKSGCHSSKHRNNSQKFLSNFFRSYSTTTDDDGSNSDDGDEASTNDENEDDDVNGADSDTDSIVSMISTHRSFAAMGIYPSHPEIQIDAALIDTGSSHLSTIGERLITAAQLASVKKTKPEYKSVRNIRGIGNSLVKTKGSMKFYFLFGGEMYTILLYIVAGDDPLILSGKDLDKLGLNYQSYYKVIERVKDSYLEEVDIRNNLPFLLFETVGFFSSKQLRAIHRNLGHPSVERQMRVIETAEIDGLDSNTRRHLEEIVKHCEACQLNKAKPRRFLFSISDDIVGEFNHVLQIDVVKIDEGNVLHIICSGTGFQQGQFLRRMTAVDAWKTLRKCWINIYAGAPDYIHADAGTNFTGEDFVSGANSMGVVVKIAPTEGHERIGKVERSHAILRSIYSKLKIDLPQISKEERLSLAFRAINDSPNSENGITPTALVFGVHPKLPGGGNRGTYAQRAKIVADCTKLAKKMKARRILRDGGKLQNSVNDAHIEAVRRLSPGSRVLIYRNNSQKKGWEKYVLAKVEGNNVNVILPSGLIGTFGIHNARPFDSEEVVSNSPPVDESAMGISGPVYEAPKGILRKETNSIDGPASRTRSRVKFALSDNVSYMALNSNPNKFLESRLAELNGLQELGCFEIVDESEAANHRIYRHSFVDKVKSDGKKKSRFCVAAFNDKDHGLFTAAPTVKRISIRLMLCITSSYGFKLATRDVKKAFVMSKTKLRRPVYMRPPAEMRIPKGQLLKVVRTLYGMPEAPMHWFKTYGDYHRDELRMKQVALDPCLWYRKEDRSLSGVLALQVDDTLFSGDPKFLALEMKHSNNFPNSGRTEVNEKPIRFNGLDISTRSDGITMDQRSYVESQIDVKSFKDLPFAEFRSVRQKIAYAAYSSMPDILVFVARLAQYTEKMYKEDSSEPLRLLKKCMKTMKIGPSLNGVRFVTIPVELMEVVIVIDAAFATNPDKSSQLGVLALIRNKKNMDANIIHFSSTKSKRVAKSVLAAELFAMIDGNDVGFSLKESVQRITGRENVDLSLFTDSNSLYGLAISLSQTTEKRLQIDLKILRESFERREIKNIVWVAGIENPADDLTKPDKRNGTLSKLLMTNKFDPKHIAWVDRDINPVRTSKF